MTQDVAKLVIAAGFALGLLFWFIAVVLYRKIAGAQTRREVEAKIPGKSPAEAIKSLVAGGRLFSPQAQVTRPAENRLAVTQAGMDLELEAIRAGADTRMVATLDDARLTRRFAIGLGIFVLILMPPVIAGVPLVLWHYVAPSETPGVRWQVLQVLQIVHVLWPPLMIYFMWRGIRNAAFNSVSNALVLAETGL